MNNTSGRSPVISLMAAVALIALMMAVSPSAIAQGFSNSSGFSVEAAPIPVNSSWSSESQGAMSRVDGVRSSSPLPVDQAFNIHVVRTQTGQTINLVPAQGYLIYRHTLLLSDREGLEINGRWPRGKDYEDGEFGKVQVFSDPVRITLPAGQEVAAVQMQGCQADGICYPPIRSVIDAGGRAGRWQLAQPQGTSLNEDRGAFPDEKETPGNAPADGSSPSLEAPKDKEEGWLPRLMAGPAGLAGFLLVGLLMAFSPCLLPMLPVTVSLVAGRAHAGRWHMAPVAWFTMAHGAVWAVGGFLAAGSGGVLLSAQLQSPGFLAAGAGLFLMLGAWQIGWIRLKLPQWSGLHPRWSENGMGPMGAMALGATSALVLGPCAAPLLAGALLAVAQAGDPWMGATGLGLMGIGMCIPMVALAAGGTGIINRMREASAWIAWVGAAGLWAVAMVLVSRLVDPGLWPWLVALWAALAMGGLWSQAAPTAGRTSRAFAAALGVVLLTGAGSGISGKGMWAQPGMGDSRASNHMVMQDIKADDLDGWITQNKGQAVVWVVADWCSVCKKFDRQTLSDARVAGRLGKMNVARVDITAMEGADVALLQELGMVGPPGVLFYRKGKEMSEVRLVGFEDADAFLSRLRGLKAASTKEDGA